MAPLMPVSTAPSQNTARKDSMKAPVSSSGPDDSRHAVRTCQVVGLEQGEDPADHGHRQHRSGGLGEGQGSGGGAEASGLDAAHHVGVRCGLVEAQARSDDRYADANLGEGRRTAERSYQEPSRQSPPSTLPRRPRPRRPGRRASRLCWTLPC